MREQYFENGYIVRRGLLPPDLIAELNQRFADVAEGHVPPAENMQVVRNVEVAKGLVTPKTKAHGISKMNFIQADPVLRKYSECGPLLDQVEDLIGPDLISMNSMYLNKPPHVDGRHPGLLQRSCPAVGEPLRRQGPAALPQGRRDPHPARSAQADDRGPAADLPRNGLRAYRGDLRRLRAPAPL